jgi:hypothetical protein
LEETVANYGDVALVLRPDWERRKENDQHYALRIVGHQDGVADAYLEEEPDKEHQFAWVDPKYKTDVAVNHTKGYRFVKKDEGWTKNDDLWEWNAEGFCVRESDYLMARPKDRFLEDMAARRTQRDKVMGGNKAEEEAERIAANAGIEISGDSPKVKRRGLRG